ncbi:putative signal peptide domain protein, partial [Vibrio parahaemolyticus 3256]
MGCYAIRCSGFNVNSHANGGSNANRWTSYSHLRYCSVCGGGGG